MKRVIFATLCACLLAATSPAQLVIDQASFNGADCKYPALASSPDGITMLAYWASGEPLLMDFVAVQKLPTRGTYSTNWPDPQILNAGGRPAICWSRTGFHAAFASGGMILVYDSDLEGNWDLENYAMFPIHGGAVSIDLLGITSDAAGPDVFLVAHTYSGEPESSESILYGSHSAFGWEGLDIVQQGNSYKSPQITWSFGPAGPYPTVFYLESFEYEMILKHTTLELGVGWSNPEHLATSPIQQEFDVLTTGLSRHLLGLGAAPVCPCGTISYQAYSSGWSDPLDMTADHRHYDWPFSPKITAGPDGRIHAFWMQLGSAPDMTPHINTLEYRVLDGGVWTDEGYSLNNPEQDGSFSPDVAIAVDPSPYPVLAWTRRDTIDSVPQPMQIFIARQPAPSAVPETETPQPGWALSAWPNPFNPMVNIAFEVEQSQMARLDVFDPRGRRVARLFDGVANPGRTELTWSGKDDTGRSLPSGVYFARLISGSRKAVYKLVLAE
jgi:hypothetical protein